jgi:hypothetical protein
LRIWVPILAITGLVSSNVAAKDAILKGLRDEHPRLILTDKKLGELKRAIAKSPEVAKAYADLREEAEEYFEKPTIEYSIPDGLRLLAMSRRCVDRMYLLGLMWRLSGEERYAERAFKELEAAAGFPDWNPKHFLDTGEMSLAFGIGYDWLYDFLSPARREFVRKALIEKGIGAYLEGHQNKAWWVTASHNWGQVCHGGVGVGALAIASEEPALAEDILEKAYAGFALCMPAYAPDGGIAEGPGYWGYATRYAVHFMAAAETALGADRGLAESPGFPESGFFRIHSAGPLGLTFNFADAGNRAGSAEVMYWLAKRFKQKAYAAHAFECQRWPNALALVWGAEFKSREAVEKKGYPPVPLDAFYRGTDVVFMRSAWNDPRAVYIGFKGGDNQANHSHLDLGSFVLDALGQRWVVDLGGDDYNLPGYWSSKRWTYYRLKNEGHNTLVLDGGIQDPRAASRIVAFESTPQRSHAVADLSKAYAPAASSVRRGIALLGRSRVLVQDEIECAAPCDADWFLHTPAEVSGEGARVVLSLGGEKLLAEILEPAGAKFTWEPAPAGPSGTANDGVTRLGIRLDKILRARIAVLLTPGGQGRDLPALEPLSSWKGVVQAAQ